MPVKLICGVDEAGRGPLAGPVFAACVVLDKRHRIKGLADSKQLSEKKRLDLAQQIKEKALAWAIASAQVDEIDQLNIFQASLLAMKRAVEMLKIMPHEVLIDGLHCPHITIPSRAIVKGDSLIAEISAASILAKTARDEEMKRLHLIYPQYGLNQHKGYPTAIHLQALQQYGIVSIHRRSFAPVKALMGQNGIITDLFAGS